MRIPKPSLKAVHGIAPGHRFGLRRRLGCVVDLDLDLAGRDPNLVRASRASKSKPGISDMVLPRRGDERWHFNPARSRRGLDKQPRRAQLEDLAGLQGPG